MAAFTVGDIAIGGQHHYIEIIDSAAAFSQMLHVLDDLGADTQTYIMGLTYRPTTGDLFSVSTPDQTLPFVEHDVDWIPDDSGLLVATVPTAGVLKFRKTNFDGTQIAEWTPAVEVGWGKQAVKISVACDARTVFYTQSLRKIQRFDIVSGTQLSDYRTLPFDSPYIFGGLRVLPPQAGETSSDDYDVAVAMTLTGDGPQRALCLDSDRSDFWVDEINPGGGVYHIQKRQLSDRTLIGSVVTQADPDADNDRTLALACYYNPCFRRRLVGFHAVIG